MTQHDSIARYLPGEPQVAGDKSGTVTADEAMLVEELSYIDRMRNRQHGGNEAEHIEKLIESLRKKQPDPSNPYLTGLALSGGGIRSATFALGVLQRLARARLLEKFDYLSTVSGGGYIGSALTWWLSGSNRTRAKVDYDQGQEFPFGTRDPSLPDPDPNLILRYLRENGRYLTPGNHITIWSGVSIFLRAVLLNLLVWIPLAGLILYLLILLGKAPFMNGLTAFIGTIAEGVLDQATGLLAGGGGTVGVDQMFPPVFLLMLAISVLLLIIFVLSSINYSLLAWIERGEVATQRLADEQGQKTLAPVGAQQSAANVGHRPGDTHMASIKRWLLVALVVAVDIAIFVAVIFWLRPLIEPLFGGGYFPDDLVGRLFLLWPGSFVLALSVIATIAITSGWDELFKGSWRGMVNLLIGFAVIIGVDGIAMVAVQEMGTTKPHSWINLGRISGAMQFSAAIGLVVLANFWTAYFVRGTLRVEGMSIRYGGRRVFEIFFGYCLPIAIGLAAIGSIPIVDTWVGIRYAGLEGAVSIVFGVGSALWGHLQARNEGIGGKRAEIVLAVGSALLVYGILLLGYRLAGWFESGDIQTRALLAGICLVAGIVGWFTNVNYVSFHRYYRDRLMEAFMPDVETVDAGVSGPARRADEMRLCDVWDPSMELGPLHLINTNAVLVNSNVRKYRIRGGDNFVLSPVYCGGNATGWQRSDTILDGGMTLASAMATSGAAANPRAAVGGRGVTRNQFLSLAMTLLSLRLGYWFPRPSPRKLLKRRPNHFKPSAQFSVPNWGYAETNAWLELSDGAHFENLGLYELVRRRCGLIVVCDGGGDPEATYGDFLVALQRIEQDFGAKISFDIEVTQRSEKKRSRREKWRSGPEQLIARTREGVYPSTAAYADRGYFAASIDYGPRGGGYWPEKGLIIYLKTTMIPKLSMKARGYKGANPAFPDESTADQFFDEEQFEAYRELGYRIADQMIDELDLIRLVADRPPVERLLSNARFKSA